MLYNLKNSFLTSLSHFLARSIPLFPLDWMHKGFITTRSTKVQLSSTLCTEQSTELDTTCSFAHLQRQESEIMSFRAQAGIVSCARVSRVTRTSLQRQSRSGAGNNRKGWAKPQQVERKMCFLERKLANAFHLFLTANISHKIRYDKMFLITSYKKRILGVPRQGATIQNNVTLAVFH